MIPLSPFFFFIRFGVFNTVIGGGKGGRDGTSTRIMFHASVDGKRKRKYPATGCIMCMKMASRQVGRIHGILVVSGSCLFQASFTGLPNIVASAGRL